MEPNPNDVIDDILADQYLISRIPTVEDATDTEYRDWIGLIRRNGAWRFTIDRDEAEWFAVILDGELFVDVAGDNDGASRVIA